MGASAVADEITDGPPVVILVFGRDQVAAATLWRQLIVHGRECALIADGEDLLRAPLSIPKPVIVLVLCEGFVELVSRLRSHHGEGVFVICVVRDVADEIVFDCYHQGADFVLPLNEDSASQILRLAPG